MKILFSIFVILGSLLWAWTHLVEPNWFRLKRITIRIKKPLERPVEILHLSDLHFTRERFFLKRFFDRLSRLEVDFVFVTGDLMDHPSGIEPCIRNLKKLKPKKGIYAVLGNHDYRNYPSRDIWRWLLTRRTRSVPRPASETDQLRGALREAGIRLLTNENVTVPSEGKEAILIGIDDRISGHSDLNRAFRGVENGALRLALTHSPRLFPALGRRGIDVAFAGHAHGGQVRIPGIGALPFARLMSPIIDSTDRFGFVGIISRGMGAQSPAHFRFLCRPEALLVRIEGSEWRA